MSDRLRVVFDCNVFAQALLTPKGAARRCVDLVRGGEIILYVSDYVLDEIRELHTKLPAKAGVIAKDTDDLAQVVRGVATFIANVPEVYVHPIDADDSPYVNLAIATGARLILSADKHLLNLTSGNKPWAKEFAERFADIKVERPDQFLQGWESSDK